MRFNAFARAGCCCLFHRHLVLNRAMLAGLVLLVCLVCCCCRFTAMRKPPSDSPSSYWLQDATASPDDEELTCDREIEHGIYTLDKQIQWEAQRVCLLMMLQSNYEPYTFRCF
ncbi:hypothetical protein B566_EDAN000839 [Ephemera danica]|nr:hypothetical protein B566_EDAN000839 [Ephemera danica]